MFQNHLIKKAESLFKKFWSYVRWRYFTCKTKAVLRKEKITLGDILEKEKVEEEFYINKDSLPQWQYLKSAKENELQVLDSNTTMLRDQ